MIFAVACATAPPQATGPATVFEQCDASLPSVTDKDPSIQAPKPIHQVSPNVPAFRGSYVVEVDSVIDETGHVSSICEGRGDPDMLRATVEAFRQWTFQPAMRDGKPIKIRYHLTTRFHT